MAQAGAAGGRWAAVGDRRRIDRSVLLQWGIFGSTIVLVAAPILPIVYQSLIDRAIYDTGHELTLQNFVDLFTEASFGRVILNSFILACASTLIAQTLGAVFAILLGRTDLPGRRIFGDILLWPLFISHLVLAFGWFMSYGSAGYVTQFVQSFLGYEPWTLYSIAGMAVIAGVSQVPLALLYCLGSAALADPSLEDAARTCGARPLRTLRSITLPLLMPAILYSAVLNFTGALEMLSIPLIFGEPVGLTFFTTFLFQQGIASPRPNYGLVGTAAVLLLAIVMLLVWLQSKLLRNTRRFVTVGGKAARPRPFPLGPLRWPAFALVLLYVMLFILFPIGVLGLRACVSFLSPLIPFWEMFTFEFFHEVFTLENTQRSILNTVVVASIGAAIGTLFIAIIAMVVHRSEFRYRRQLEYVALFPRALPGIIAGLGFFYAVVLLQPLGWLRNTILILIIAYIMRYIPTGYGALAPALLQIGADLDRSARVAGADWWTSMQAIIMRVMKPALFTCFALLFINFFKEYSTAIFLFAPGSEVIGTTLLQFWVQGEMGRVAALSSLQIVLTVFFIYCVRRALGVRIYG
jgi:iron(III) transport system permease protein